MTKTRKARTSFLVPVADDVPLISTTQRVILRRSLDKARADIAAGNYDLVTTATLRKEFASVFRRRRGRSAEK
jgi:hypothetical protein